MSDMHAATPGESAPSQPNEEQEEKTAEGRQSQATSGTAPSDHPHGSDSPRHGSPRHGSPRHGSPANDGTGNGSPGNAVSASSAPASSASETAALTAHLDGALKWYAQRAITVGGILGGIVSLFTLFIGYETLTEFRIQNEQLIQQNDFLKEQAIQNQQATNASALSQLIKDVETEHEQLSADERASWQPSRPLQYRIASVSRALKPYRDGAGNGLAVSPERALLLRVLLDLNVDLPLNPQTTFVQADLRGLIFEDAALADLDLSGVDLRGATFLRGSLDRVLLEDARLSGAKLIRVSLDRTDFSGADLREAAFWGSDLTDSKLDKVRLDYAVLDQSALPGVEGSPNTWKEQTTGANSSIDAGTSPSNVTVTREVEKTICDAESLVMVQMNLSAFEYVCAECPTRFGDVSVYQSGDPRRCGAKSTSP